MVNNSHWAVIPASSAILCSVLMVTSCRKKTESEPPQTTLHASQQGSLLSVELRQGFPLFPIVEKQLWRELLVAEGELASGSLSPMETQSTVQKTEELAHQLRQRHPFHDDAETTRLGGITYDKTTRNLELFAEVHLPKKDAQGRFTELELVLCSAMGRSHETLFITETRPLHLELLLHLAGFQKHPTPETFKLSISIPNNKLIPVESMIETTTGAALPSTLLWEFSGSSFDDLYPPDQTGDLILCWHAHDSVLRIQHDGIGTGETKIRALTHPLIRDGMKVKLILTPIPPAQPTPPSSTVDP